jgi:hypothetical protein
VRNILSDKVRDLIKSQILDRPDPWFRVPDHTHDRANLRSLDAFLPPPVPEESSPFLDGLLVSTALDLIESIQQEKDSR